MFKGPLTISINTVEYDSGCPVSHANLKRYCIVSQVLFYVRNNLDRSAVICVVICDWPSFKYVSSTGHYMFLEVAKKPEVRAQIQSPWYARSGPECKMVFGLHMHGQRVGSLKILLVTENMTRVIKSMQGDQGDFQQSKYVCSLFNCLLLFATTILFCLPN